MSAIHTGPASVDNAIPAGGMVLSVSGSPESTFLANASVGDRLRMRFDTNAGAYNNADMAITGIGWLVHNGVAQHRKLVAIQHVLRQSTATRAPPSAGTTRTSINSSSMAGPPRASA